MSDPNRQVIEDLGKAWEDFKEVNDQRLAEIEKTGEATAETLTKLDRIENAMDLAEENRKRIEQIEATASLSEKAEDKADDAQKAHRDAFLKWIRRPDDTETKINLKHAERAAYEAMPDEQKAVTLTTTGGGNAIPTLVAGIISQKIIDMSPVRSLARVVSSANELTRFLVSDNNSTSGWVGAGSSRTATTEPLIQSVVPTYGTCYGYTSAYEEAVHDISFDVQSWLIDDISRRLAAAEGTAFVSGNGTDKPTGFTNGSPSSSGDEASPQRAFATVEYVPTGAAAGFQPNPIASPTGNPADVFLDAIYALKPAYRSSAVWLMNATVLATVRKFKDVDGDYLYRPNMQGGMGDLFGYQVQEDANMADLGSNTYPAVIADFSEFYLVADIQSSLRLTVDDNITVPGIVKFYSRRRLGGKVLNDDAGKLVKCAVT